MTCFNIKFKVGRTVRIWQRYGNSLQEVSNSVEQILDGEYFGKAKLISINEMSIADIEIMKAG